METITPDDMLKQELEVSETTEDDTKLTGDEQNEMTQWEPDWAYDDMLLEQYDPEMFKSIAELYDIDVKELLHNIDPALEMEALALAEPEPPVEP